ncbi:MAG: hypothetical protein WC907_05555 [Acholeplasmataceae bacterium]
MSIEIKWFNGNIDDILIYISEKNISVNKAGKHFFTHANKVMLGINKEENSFYIKPLSKANVIRGDIPNYKMFNLKVKKDNVLINNLSFIKLLIKEFNLKLNDDKITFKAVWNPKDDYLNINLTEVVPNE